MATVKKANVPPTHPTVWVGLALAVVGLLVATFAYTGTRVYDIAFAFTALAGGLLALAGILTAAWGRSIMAARASRSRRGLIKEEALKLDEQLPTVATTREKKRFAFPLSRREKPEKAEAQGAAGVFAFKRRAPEPEPVPEPEPPMARDDPRNPEVQLETPDEEIPITVTSEPESSPESSAEPVRVTLRCPQCSQTFSAEGVRPFTATCGNCGFSANV